MNICREFRDHVFEILSGEAQDSHSGEYWRHYEDCPLCREELRACRRVWEALDHDEELEVPSTLRAATLALVHSEARKEEARALARPGRLTARRLLGAAASGVALALFFILLLGHKVDVQPLSSEQLLAIGTLWSGILIVGFCWIFGRFRLKGIHLDSVTLLAVAGTVIVLIGTYLCPDSTAYGWWRMTSAGSAVEHSIGSTASCFLFGVLYVLPAALLLSGAFRERFKNAIARHATLSAAIYVGLLLPAIYMQCVYLAKGLMFSWVCGSFLGALVGIWGGVRIWRMKKVAAY